MFLIPVADQFARSALTELSSELGVTVRADPDGVRDVVSQQAARIGVYQGWAGAMDEGWTRLVLEEFDYLYETLMNEDVREEDLVDRFDVILLPSEISLNRLIVGDTSATAPP